MQNSLFIKNATYYQNKKWNKGSILIQNGLITSLNERNIPHDIEVFDAKGYKIIPGLVDPHVHFALNCGTITSRDDFISGSKIAALGGVTTFVDFLDPSSNEKELLETYQRRVKEAEDATSSFHFHACIKEPNCDLESYVKTMLSLKINTLKLFTTYSETKRKTSHEDIEKLLILSKKYNFLLLVHAEDDFLVDIQNDYSAVEISQARNSNCELSEVDKLASLVERTKGYLYIVHLSSGETLQMLKDKYSHLLGKNLFIESCPQYFLFNKEVLDSKDGLLYTFAPPLRSEKERALLVKLIDDVDTIGTDHCSFTKQDKLSHPRLKGHPLGIGGIETSFLILHHLFGDKIIEKMSENIAKLQRFSNIGAIFEGNFADLVFLKKVDEYPIGKPHGNVDYSIYEGSKVDEEIVHVMSRGQFVVKNKKYIGSKDNKNLILKECANYD